MSQPRLACVEELPVHEHHRPAVAVTIAFHQLCEAAADGAHLLVEHAITVAWVRRPPAWTHLDLAQFHETAQFFAYADLFHEAAHLRDIRHVEFLAARVQSALDANPLLHHHRTDRAGAEHTRPAARREAGGNATAGAR
ncbi:hypothetical protein OG455_27855 [Kitasatospora sp. NBC_01287]|uniref:hypothetical protein n=1 Tax=Kitasatospora sp. NBC_01287 TaxID=2903573 RepID=UPI002258B231|nr:hypothetical protein [Kitasatospora sp. NBC_01287]MCX4749277.1 hypothetical protein [Kitasatospora sp. NBC_01287]